MSNAITETPTAPMTDAVSLLDAAKTAFAGGRLDEASRTCERLLDGHGDDPAAWFVLGAAQWKSGAHDRAITAFGNAVSGHRSNLEYRLMLARVQREAGYLDDAIETLDEVIAMAPRSFEARMALGTARIAAGRSPEGVADCRKGFRLLAAAKLRELGGLTPWISDSVAAAVRVMGDRGCDFALARRFEAARRLAREGAFDRAVGVCRAAVAEAPEYAGGVALLGRLLTSAGDHLGALDCFERARRLDPGDDGLKIGLARALGSVSRHDDALDEIAPIAGTPGCRAEADCVRGKSLYGIGRAAEAQAVFEGVLAREPDNAEAIHGLARCHMELGRIEAAKPWLDRLLQRHPDYAAAYRDLAGSGQLPHGGVHFTQAKTLLEGGRLTGDQQVALHLAVAAAEDQAGRADAAFAHLRIGNTLKNVVHSPTAHAALVDRLCAAFDAEFFRRAEGWGNPSKRPVFILGMPRSGTTLVEQILASHPRVFGAGELNDMILAAARLPEALAADEPYPQCAQKLTPEVVGRVSTAYLHRLERRSGGADLVSDKMPGNFLHLGLIATLFPRARIVHCRRDAQDTCLSIYFHDFEGHHPYAYDLTNLGHYYRQYERLMEHWRAVIPNPILDMPYEDMVGDQQAMTHRLLEFCGLDWDDRCLAFHESTRPVHTSSFAEVRKPIYRSAIARHQRYAAHLGALRHALGLEPEPEA